jgi:membrane-associated phospholipid phosphatase
VIAALAGVLAGGLSPRMLILLRLVPPIVVFCTTTYLAYHWITDSVAGLLLGLVLTRMMARVPWETVPLPRLTRATTTDRRA